MKHIKKTFLIVLIFLIGGLGGIIANRYIFPYLSTTEFFSKNKFLKKTTDETTIINKTEQIYVKEDSGVEKVASQVSSSIVRVVSFSDKTKLPSSEIISSGAIITSDGLIVTYAENSDWANLEHKVVLPDGNYYDSQLVGVDSYSNLAFLKIVASNLPALPMADSSQIKSGEKIVAIGSLLGQAGGNYSSGVIKNVNFYSNLAGKTVSSSEKLEGVFEIDLNLDSNFLGAIAVDYSGQAIGILGKISKNNLDYYFIIPANKLRSVTDRAIAKELDKNPTLGAYYLSLNQDQDFIRGFSENEGAVIYSPSGQQGLAIINGSNAEKAGLQIGDVIVKVNDQKINYINSLSDTLYRYRAGDKVTLTIKRNGQEITKEVSL